MNVALLIALLIFQNGQVLLPHVEIYRLNIVLVSALVEKLGFGLVSHFGILKLFSMFVFEL